VNTLRPAEETWVDQGKGGQIKNHKDGTTLGGVYLVTDVNFSLFLFEFSLEF